jgi:predicted nucleic acid-binding protein
MELIKRYDLHAADSLQMAAALQWCEGIPQGRVFLTADGRLRDAARLVGFDV